tara:strand:- start:57 stop:410 length:354 start_codon:yes stop_codon:yes gene_type:complete
MSRNSNRRRKSISRVDNSELFKNRDTDETSIYLDSFLHYPDESVRRDLSYEEHIWSAGDKYYKLGRKYYGSRKDWWVIARFNGKPTEADLSIGDKLIIPYPLDVVKDFMGYYNNASS